MDQGQIFIVSIVAIIMCAQVIRFAIMARAGFPLHKRKHRDAMRRPRHPFAFMAHGWASRDDDQDADDPAAQRKIELLSAENEKLTGQLSRLEERLRVLERIATDPATRTAREIDALRDGD
jgi:hypothetical protein